MTGFYVSAVGEEEPPSLQQSAWQGSPVDSWREAGMATVRSHTLLQLR